MNIPVGDAGFGQGKGQLVAIVDNLIYLFLFLRELAGSGVRAREIRGIMFVTLHTGVYHHQLAGLNDGGVTVIVQGLSVLGENGGERYAPALGEGDGLHPANYFLLHQADFNSIPGYGMHLVSQITSVVNSINLNILLDKTHRDDSLDEGLGRGGSGKEFLQHQGIVITGWGQKMHRTAFRALLKPAGEFRIGPMAGDSHQRGLGLYAGLRAHPDDVIHIHIIGKEDFFSGIYAEDRGHQRFIQTPVIEPGTVLAPFVAIVFVLGGGFCVSDEQDQAGLSGFAHSNQERLSATFINFSSKHSIVRFDSSKIMNIFVEWKP